MPPFSQAIHRFTNNVSEMKNLAARDYEDMLQVRLLPAHDTQHTHHCGLSPSRPCNVPSRPCLSRCGNTPISPPCTFNVLLSHPYYRPTRPALPPSHPSNIILLSCSLSPGLVAAMPHLSLAPLSCPSCHRAVVLPLLSLRRYLNPPIAALYHLFPLLLGQCAIPAFEGLLHGDHDKRLLKLLYRTAEWHGLAKLRMHTQATLDHLETLTNEYGRLMRSFHDLMCSQFTTKELQRDVDVRKRAQQHAQARGLSKGSISISERWEKTFNLFTPKFHALGDYVRTIQMFGTTDSYSTQVV